LNIHGSTQQPKELNMSRTPNDDRSDSLNPNSDAYSDSMDNHSDQLNPNNPEYQGGQDDSEDVSEED
jgi:hypothetical protein